MVVRLSFSYSLDKKTEVIRIPQCYYYNYYKDLFTHKDINTYINGIVKICLNKFFFENTGFQKKREKICKIMHKQKTMIFTHYITYLSFQLLRNHRILQHINYSFLY